jgi:hypothetical protein
MRSATVGAANTLGALPLLLAVGTLHQGEVGALGADQHTAPNVIRLLLHCSYTGVMLIALLLSSFHIFDARVRGNHRSLNVVVVVTMIVVLVVLIEAMA